MLTCTRVNDTVPMNHADFKTQGTACCHATMDVGGKHLLAANYMSGNAIVFGVNDADVRESLEPI